MQFKKYRQLAEMTQDELAGKVGVRRETIIRLEAGNIILSKAGNRYFAGGGSAH